MQPQSAVCARSNWTVATHNRRSYQVSAYLRVHLRLHAALVALIVAVTVFPGSIAAQTAPFCPPGQPPVFVLGFADLKLRLGVLMGEPVECEHWDPQTGDTLQRTTTGLAYFRAQTGAVTFTNGSEHWALLGNQLLYWQTGSVDPPLPTAAERAYLDAAAPLLSQFDNVLADLNAYALPASAGTAIKVEFSEAGALLDQIVALRTEHALAEPSARLATYDDLLDQMYAASQAAGEALLRAELADSAALTSVLLDEFVSWARQANELRYAASAAYASILAVPLN